MEELTATIIVEPAASQSGPLRMPPTPKGEGDLTQLQDALANALCPMEGTPLDSHREPVKRDRKSPEPALEGGNLTGCSLVSDWNLSESEDEGPLSHGRA